MVAAPTAPQNPGASPDRGDRVPIGPSEAAGHAVVGTDLHGTITIFDGGAQRMLGYRATDLVGQATPVVLHDATELAARGAELGIAPGFEVLASSARHAEPETRRWTYVRKDGSRLAVELTVTALLGADDQPTGFVSVARELRSTQRSETDAGGIDDRFHRAFEVSPIGLAISAATPDDFGRYLEVNRALCTLTGYAREQLLGMTSQELTHPADVARGADSLRRLISGEVQRIHNETRYLRAGGDAVELSVGVSLVRDERGRPLQFLSRVEDVSARKHYEQQLQHMASHDPLTGLLNRTCLNAAVKRHLAHVRRHGPRGALLMVDIDHFKLVNDRLGHNAGDKLLLSVARTLQDRVRDTDVLARIGGDEFAVLVTEGGEADAQVLAADLSELVRLRAGVLEGGVPGGITVSVGIAALDDRDDLRADDLFAEADAAMYTAKENGRDQVAAYVTADGTKHRRAARLTLSRQIDAALIADRFELHLQPSVDLRTGVVNSHEVLLRMVGQDGVLLSPATFLYVAERFEQIHAIDRWVVEHAVALLPTLGPDQALEINLSGRSLGDPQLAQLDRRRPRRPARRRQPSGLRDPGVRGDREHPPGARVRSAGRRARQPLRARRLRFGLRIVLLLEISAVRLPEDRW